MDNTIPSAVPIRTYRALNPTQLLRTQETKRLTETKLQNIENNIKQLQETKVLLEKRKRLRTELEEEKASLRSLEKSLAVMTADRKQLERLEAFESIAATFLKLKILQRLSAENNRNISDLEHEADILQQEWDEQAKRQQQAHAISTQAEEQVATARDIALEGMRLEGSTEEAQKELEYLNIAIFQKKKEIDDTKKSLEAQAEEVELLKQDLERNRAGRASMEMHELMLEQVEKILLMLELLQESKNNLTNLRAKQKEAIKSQDDENEKLGLIFSEYQDITSKISTLEEILETHQQNLQGQDSYKVQERSMTLKARLQMLIQAKLLWKRISSGYASIEEKEESLAELSHRIDQDVEYMKQLREAEANSALDRLNQEFNFKKGRLQALEENLMSLRQRQAEDVNEWQIFASLDKQFQDCSASTNAETRSAILELLIDNTTSDEDAARKELEALNFHQKHITDISEKLQALAQERNEITMRMGEVNTGCQVMAGQVERIQALIEAENDRYKDRYEELDRLISIKDWLFEWQKNHEAFKARIKQLSEAWKTVNERIALKREDLNMEEAKLQYLKELLDVHNMSMDILNKRKEALLDTINSNTNEHKRLLADKSAQELLSESHNAILSAYKTESEENKASAQIKGNKDRVLGRNDFHIHTGEELAKELAKERSVLDVWMHNYNTHHSPVQYQELEDVFESGRDWNAVRKSLRPLLEEEALRKQRIETLERELLMLNVGNSIIDANDEYALTTLQEQIKEYRSESLDLTIQLARMTINLEEHEKAMQNAGC